MRNGLRAISRAVVVGLVAWPCDAATLHWQGGTGTLLDPNYFRDVTLANGATPATGDTINFGATGTGTFSGGTALSWAKLRVGHNQTTPAPSPALNGTGTITLSGAGTAINLTGGASGLGNQGLLVGNGFNGVLTVTDGASVTSNIQVGVGVGSNLSRTGTLNVSNGGSVTATAGNFNIAVGASATGNGLIGIVNLSGATSAINVSGSGADLNIGSSQTAGTYTQTGGTLTVDDIIEVGTSGGSSDGSSFSISGGTATNGGNVFVGRGDSQNASLSVSGTGILNVGSRLLLGGSGMTATGTVVNQSGGTVNTTLDVRVADASASSLFTSVYNLSGTGVINSTTGGYVGRQGTGTFNQTGGTANWNGAFFIGNRETAAQATTGLYKISGGDANFNTTLGIGTKGIGELRVVGDDATIDITSALTVSSTVDGTGTLAFELETGDVLSMVNVGTTATFASGSRLVFDTSNAAPTQTVYNLLTAVDVIDNGLSFTGPVGWNYQIVPGGNGEILQVAIPEPTAIAFALPALVGLLACRQRRGR